MQKKFAGFWGGTAIFLVIAFIGSIAMGYYAGT